MCVLDSVKISIVHSQSESRQGSFVGENVFRNAEDLEYPKVILKITKL